MPPELEPGAQNGGQGNPDPKDGNGAQNGGQAAGQQADPGTQADPKLDESKWDADTKAYIAKLRGENAAQRTKAKDWKSKADEALETQKKLKKALGIEPDADPKEKLESLTQAHDRQTLQVAALQTALQHGISADDFEFFEFRLQKALGELKDGEELSDDALGKIVADVKKRSGGNSKANTTVGGGNGNGAGGGNPPPAGQAGDVTLDAFVKMNMTQKSQLYGKNPQLYEKLMLEARSTNRLV